jgi:ubiquinol-cytochrome c reductase cytochrome c1 subunit
MKTLLGIVILAMPLWAQAAVSVKPLDQVAVDVFDLKSVQRGADYFVDYCMGCHSLKHLRYSRIGKDLGLTEEGMRQGLMVGGAKMEDSLLTAMDKEDAEKWFGVAPPDLSLIARARGDDWLYNYLKGFYVDPTTPTGVNNIVYENVSMPNVLWELQGTQKAVLGKEDGADVIKGLELVTHGKMSPQQFDQAVTDLVTFLVYAAEPAQYERLRLGKYVLLGLLILTVIFYRLKKEYWKDID